MHFPITRGLLKKQVGEIKAVDGVSFTLRRGETLGLVGESGCGKTTVGRCISRVYTADGGAHLVRGQRHRRHAREGVPAPPPRLAVIFQDPYSSLDPRQTAGSIVGEPLKIHKMVESKAEYDEKVESLFAKVGLDPGLMSRYRPRVQWGPAAADRDRTGPGRRAEPGHL